MKNIIKVASLALVMVFSLAYFGGPYVSAAFNDSFQDACDSSETANSDVCKDVMQNYNKTTDELRADYINKIANIIAAVGGIIALIMIMVNGLTLLMSTGDTAKVNKARDGLIYAAVGIVVIVMARVIVSFIMRFI